MGSKQKLVPLALGFGLFVFGPMSEGLVPLVLSLRAYVRGFSSARPFRTGLGFGFMVEGLVELSLSRLLELYL